MSTEPKIVNVTATARLGKRLALEQMGLRLAPFPVKYVALYFIAACVHIKGVAISLFPNGKVVATGASSVRAANAVLVTLARKLRMRIDEFKVVNICATWSTGQPRASVEAHRLTDPRAYVKVTTRGTAICMGIKNETDLTRVHRLIQ